MSAIEQRARELLDEIPASPTPEAQSERVMVWEKDALAAIIAALTPPEGWVSPDDLLEAQDRAFCDGMSKCACPAPDGFVLVPVDSVSQCGCGCHRYCCRHCGTELGGHSYEPTRQEAP